MHHKLMYTAEQLSLLHLNVPEKDAVYGAKLVYFDMFQIKTEISFLTWVS